MNTVSGDKLRAWWASSQGLDDSLQGKAAADVLNRAGWARSVGGVGPYLTLHSRAGLSRGDIDSDVAKAKIHELPAARGCTYVVPESGYAIALTVGQQFSAESEFRLACKFGVTEKEIDKLRSAILRALESGPLDTEEIRNAVGSAARSLGPEAKKKGITTTLPVALGLLQSGGEIRRIPVNGRLDQQRYKYSAWKENPLLKWKKSRVETFADLARLFFSWICPARIADFQSFSGLGVKAARESASQLDLSDLGEGWLIPAGRRDAFEKFQAPKKPHYTLVSSIDSIGLAYGEIPQAKERPCDHYILDRGRLVGLWAFDSADGTIVWNSFIKPDAALREAVRNTEVWVREQLGDARAFSLDSPKSRAPHLAKMREAGIF
jgi:hypothetical protein